MRPQQKKSHPHRILPPALHRQQLRVVLRRGLEAEARAVREDAGVSEEPSLRENLSKLSKAEWFYIIIHLVLIILFLPLIVLTIIVVVVGIAAISAEAIHIVLGLFSFL